MLWLEWLDFRLFLHSFGFLSFLFRRLVRCVVK